MSPQADSFYFKYFLSCCAATTAECVTYPLDLTKTRLQLQGEVAASSPSAYQYRGMFRTAMGIASEEGVLQLWQGLAPAIYRHIIYTGCRMAFYEWIRDNMLGKGADGMYPIWKAVIGGSVAGGMAQLFASPADLVKIHMQMEGLRRLEGKSPRVHNTPHAVKEIVSKGGVSGLWKGWVPNVQRAALVNMGDLATYDTVKHALLKHTSLQDNHFTHALASGASGFVAATLSTPADVVKTRVMNQPTCPQGKGMLYRSSVDCLLQTVKQEGFFALYKGFVPIWARMGPWSLTFWITYEQIRQWCGVSSF